MGDANQPFLSQTEDVIYDIYVNDSDMSMAMKT